MVSIFNSEQDTVTRKLKALPDSVLSRIKIDPYIFMFDTIRKGQIVSGKFKIKNISRNTF